MKQRDCLKAKCLKLAVAVAFIASCKGGVTISTNDAATVGRAEGDASNGAMIEPDSSAASKPEPLSPADFRLWPLPSPVDTVTVLAEFGRPDSVSQLQYPADRVSLWQYGSVGFLFADDGEMLGFGLTDDQFTTARGLKVGDPQERVLALYGAPVRNGGHATQSWRYTDNLQPHRSEVASHDIIVNLKHGVVHSIHVGWVIVG